MTGVMILDLKKKINKIKYFFPDILAPHFVMFYSEVIMRYFFSSLLFNKISTMQIVIIYIEREIDPLTNIFKQHSDVFAFDILLFGLFLK